MSQGNDSDHDRQFGTVVVAGLCILALAILAVSVPGVGGTLEETGEGPVDIQEPRNEEARFLIGAGAMGGGSVSPIGVEADSEDAESPFRNISSELLFAVETRAPSYWRVDAYDRYDEAWKRTGELIQYQGSIPSKRPVTARIKTNVTLFEPAAALPAVYQPSLVEGINTDNLRVSQSTGLHPTEVVPANSNYSVSSYRYRPSPASLEEAGSQYPLSIEEQYTQLPSDLPPRVETLGNSLAEETSNPYETSSVISRSLAKRNNYSLQATYDRDADPVDHFLFERDEGDATAFASSMVVLLRTQDIPARYVTGYSVGAPLEERNDTYGVRSVNAHAWVEVYFPGHGWIAFDPTPVEERLATEDAAVGIEGAMVHVPLVSENASELGVDSEQVLEEDLSSDEEIEEDSPTNGSDTGSGEEGTDQNSDTGETNDSDQSQEEQTEAQSPLAVAIEPQAPEPGTVLTVTVTRDGQPVTDIAVKFNEKMVGLTNRSGIVQGTVPYTSSLRITATTETNTTTYSSETAAQTDEQLSLRGAGGTAGFARDDDGLAILASSGELTSKHDRASTLPEAKTKHTAPQKPTLQQSAGEITTTAGENTTVVNVPVTAQVSVAINPEPMVAGGEGSVMMMINGDPVSGANVSIGDQSVGETSETGELTFSVPAVENETAIPVTVQRGELRVERQVLFGHLEATRRGDDGLVMPWQTVDLQVTVGGIPVSEAEVRQDGDVIGTTDSDGQLSTTLPLARSTDFQIRYAGQQISYSISGMIETAGLISGFGLLMAIGLFIGGRRYWRGGEPEGRIDAKVDQLVSRLQTIVFGSASWILTRLVNLQSSISNFWNRDKSTFDSPMAALAGLWARRPQSPVQSVLAGFGAILSLILGTIQREPEKDVDDLGVIGEGSTADTGDQRLSVQQVWSRFIRLIFRRVDTTRTPTELAEDAVKAGLPSGPVQRLTESFRAVEYGAADPDQYEETANMALSDIEERTETNPDGANVGDPTENESSGERR